MQGIQKNQQYTIHIDGLTASGQGVGRIDGFAVFVPFALPEEEVTIRVVKAQKNYAFAKLESIVQASAERKNPLCPVFGRCGGCTLQHLSYAGQKRAKRQFVVDALQRIGGIDCAEEITQPLMGMEEPWYYRNKLSLPIGMGADERTCMGFYAPRSHRIVETTECPLQGQSIEPLRSAVLEYMEISGASVYDETRRKGTLRHLYSRHNRKGESMVVAVVNGDLPKPDVFKEGMLMAISGLTSLQVNRNTYADNVIMSNDFFVLWGSDRLEMHSQGMTYDLSPASFWQVNSLQMEALYEAALAMVDWQGTEFVIDAYCGVGSISLPLARRAKKVLGIEVAPGAVEDATENARRNGVGNVSFVCGATEEVLPKVYKETGCPDVLFLDPPRKGCDSKVLNAVVESEILQIVYISCDPATQARDMKVLVEGGYELIAALPVDMFPQTAHVENICMLRRRQ